MTVAIPTSEPTALRAGDTWQWRREDLAADYPASAYTLTYHFRNATAKFDIAAAADGDAFAVSVAIATTATRAAGWYDWVAVVADLAATERHEVGRGRVQVLANYALDAVLDGRSFARQMLEAIEATLLNRASDDQLDLIAAASEGGRSIARDKTALILLRSQFRNEVAREDHAARIASGLGSKYRILARFN